MWLEVISAASQHIVIAPGTARSHPELCQGCVLFPFSKGCKQQVSGRGTKVDTNAHDDVVLLSSPIPFLSIIPPLLAAV